MRFVSLWGLTLAVSHTKNPVQLGIILQVLRLTNMNLERIEVGAFCGIMEISSLGLYSNKLTSLPQLCSLKCCLATLNMANNKISLLSKNFFKGFKQLGSINLGNNNLIVLPDLHWIQHSVWRLVASKNKIQSLDALQTSGIYRRLSTISVSNNNISNFNVSLLRQMPQLGYFTLSDNKLFHVDDVRGFNIRQLFMMENPWHCDEELSWMGEEDMDFEQGLTCATPTCLHGMVIADMSKWIIESHILHFRGLTWPKSYSDIMVNYHRAWDDHQWVNCDILTPLPCWRHLGNIIYRHWDDARVKTNSLWKKGWRLSYIISTMAAGAIVT